MNCFTNEKTLT